jgi:glycine oxidase
LGAALVPSLRDADLNWGLAGLRPGSADDVPIIGPLPDYDNVYVASGHFRNGILLSLATGEAIAGMLDGSPSDNLASFSPARFL